MDEDQKSLPETPPSGGNEYLYSVMRRLETMFQETKDALLSDHGPIAALRSDVQKVHNDYMGLHNLMVKEQARNEANWRLMHDELEKVRRKQDVQATEISEAKGSIIELQRRVETLESKVG